MLSVGDLASAFEMYWDDMDRCRNGGAFWSLLHVTVCLPDICAALQANNGGTSGAKYASWCDKWLPDSLLTGSERYRMRCKVLHQGRAATDVPGRYAGFSFAQPAPDGQVDHRRVDGTTLILDVGELAGEVKAGVNKWIRWVESNLNSAEAANVDRNLPSLVRVRQFVLPRASAATPGMTISRSS